MPFGEHVENPRTMPPLYLLIIVSSAVSIIIVDLFIQSPHA